MASGETLSAPVQMFVSRGKAVEGGETPLDYLESHLRAHHWTLVRHLQYYAIALRDLVKATPKAKVIGKKTLSGNVNAAWTETLDYLNSFRSRLNASGLLCGIFGSAASLRNFALGHVDNIKWPYPRLLVVLFIIDQLLQRSDRELLGKLMRERLPVCEIEFLLSIRRGYLDGKAECPLRNTATEPTGESQQPGAQPRPLLGTFDVADNLPRIQSFIQSRFAVEQDAAADFRRYFDLFCSGPKKYLHMICFRGQRSHPSSLVISFLAIIPPEANELTGEFSFKHIYQISRGDRPRISQGIVLPLAGGVYLIGGQQSYDKKTRSFITLKIIALPWRALNSQEVVLPGLLMSASRDDQHLVSKVALRPTGATRHEQASIGLRHISETENYLQGLSVVDSNESFVGRDRVTGDASTQAARITQLTNNQPREWDLIEVFRDANGVELDRVAFEAQLQKSFGRPAERKFTSISAGSFAFPDSLWLGPITTDR